MSEIKWIRKTDECKSFKTFDMADGYRTKYNGLNDYRVRVKRRSSGLFDVIVKIKQP
jgi:hypothetical protein